MQVGTVVRVADNSGAIAIRVIKVLRAYPTSRAKLGDFVVGSVLSVHSRKKFKVSKGTIVRALVVRIADTFKRKDGQSLRFGESAVVIATRTGSPRSTKIYGPVPKELRELGFIRLVSLSTIAL